MEQQFAYDVFLSHAQDDMAVARKIANGLKQRGFNVWFEGWRLGSEGDIKSAMNYALEASRVLVLVITKTAHRPDTRTLLESHAIPFRDPANQGRRLVPLLIDQVAIPEAFRPFAFVDWSTKSKTQWESLVQACARRTRTEPTTQSREPRWIMPATSGGRISALSVCSDGSRCYCARAEGSIEAWDLRAGQKISQLKGHFPRNACIVVAPNGDWVFDRENTLERWSTVSGSRMSTTPVESSVLQLHTNTNGSKFLAAHRNGSVSFWTPERNSLSTIPLLYSMRALTALSRNGQWFANYSQETLQVGTANAECAVNSFSLTVAGPSAVAISNLGGTVLVGSTDGLIQIIDPAVGRCIGYLEGHKGVISALDILSDSHTALSASHDGSVRLWNLDNGACLLELVASKAPIVALASTPNAEVVLGTTDTGVLSVWQVDILDAVRSLVPGSALRYTNAKVLLVGESGVGKSALAQRLVYDTFAPTASTDGAWATQMKFPHCASNSSIEREIWLWDFAGQADYRLIHQLFFDETALAILVFNPQTEEPFDGLAQWDNDLLRASKRPYKKLLVAGRIDRGRLMVSNRDVDTFVTTRGFTKYLDTSAATGFGCSELREAIASSIQWDQVPWTASPRVFKLLKDAIVALKDETLQGNRPVVLRMIELKQQLEMRLVSERFAIEDLQAVVALLAGPGIIWHLAFGDFVLLQPERINAYAAAVVRTIRSHPDEIGVIEEDRILDGDLDYADLKRLPRVEELIVLRAMHQTFVDRGLCLRQHTTHGTLLLFPSYFRRQRPDLSSHPAPLVTYTFSGQLDEIYATLVVRLGHTSTFERDQLWRFAADFLTPEGRRAGFKMTKLGEGTGELTIYCDPHIPDDTKVTFIRYIHDHLESKDHRMERERHYVCMACHNPVENSLAVKRRLSRGEKDIACSDCESRVPLVDLIEERFAAEDILGRARELEAAAAAAIDNESKELILVGHAYAVAGEAGQIFRATANSDWGIDGEIEFKDKAGNASGIRLYLQLKSGDSYLTERQSDGAEIFRVRNKRHINYWVKQAYPVMLVVRTSDGRIRWMDISQYLTDHPGESTVVFSGEPFTAASLRMLRNKIVGREAIRMRGRRI